MKFIKFISEYTTLFPNKFSIKNKDYLNRIFKKHCFKLEKEEDYKSFFQFLLKVSKSIVSSKEKEKEYVLSSLSRSYNYISNNKTYYKKMLYKENEVLFLSIQKATINKQLKELIFIKFFYNKPLYQLIKSVALKNKLDFKYDKLEEKIVIEYSEKFFIDFLEELDKIKNKNTTEELINENLNNCGLKLIVDLNGIMFYSILNKKS